MCGFAAECRTDFDVVDQADTTKASIAGARCAAAGKTVPVGTFHGRSHERFIITRIVGTTRWRFIGKLIGTNQISPANLVRRQTGFSCSFVDQALEQICGLGPARAAVRIRWHGIRDHHLDIDISDRNVIGSGGHAGAKPGNDRACLRAICAEVSGYRCTHGRKSAVVIDRQFGAARMVAAMQVRKETLVAVPGPFDRPAGVHRRMCRNDRFALQEELEPECAPDIRGNDMDAVPVQVDRTCDPIAQCVHALTALVNRQIAAVPGDVAAARFHRCRSEAVVDNLNIYCRCCVVKRFVGRATIAVLEMAVTVSRDIVVYL